ncbi:BTAD domain-containing putative transcriptional regulator [Nocardiopsis sp. CT-R113]|uniref:BTAD domain-containing putative transcriptional regulator n=1 Tax=Nocardiopsis codii TaxID=3065942 RepID=A0ABU7KB27_9ACTN|nr:BTAD domain-containing putative transcriptional regulator [Nocardiopsis sp. CT-R113]MEE2039444.1 BTAD domain-containing putative transcriptional regulator [Nocardiopsis sp. CT-R113]
MQSILSAIRYRLLGSVEVHRGGRRVPLGGPKRRTVLAALLLRPNTVVADDRLIDLVWGDDPPRSARPQLQVHIHELRKRLGTGTIVRHSYGYELVADPGETDAEQFRRLVVRARTDRAARRRDEAAGTLRSAMALWTGPALGGVTASLEEKARPALEESRLCALEELYGVEVERGRGSSAVSELRTLCSEHPTRESFVALLMSALDSCGRTGEAVEAYAALRDLFARELGIDPSAPLQRLHLRLLSQGQEEERPRRQPPVRPAELPHAVRGFVARDRELAVLDAGRDGRASLFLLTGVPGVGKTALALHWGHMARGGFPDGQLYLDLRGSCGSEAPTEPDDALRQLLRSLGADTRDLPGDSPGLAKLFRSMTADRRLLILLDDAASAEQVAPLLPGGPDSTVLVTGRRDLPELVALFGAVRVRLDVLSEESSAELFRFVAGDGAPDAGPSAEPALADDCGGLPLALRMAAATMGLPSPAQSG